MFCNKDIILDDIRQVFAESELQRNSLRSLNESFNQTLCEMKKQLCKQLQSEEKMRKELENKECTIKSLKTENFRLEESLQNTNSVISKMCTTVNDVNRYVCKLEEQTDCQKKQNCSLEGKINDLERCLQEKDLSIHCTEEQVEETEEMLCEMKDKLKASQDENESTKQLLVECHSILEERNTEMNCMSKRLKKSECEQQMLTCKLVEIQACLEDRNNSLENERYNNSKLKNQIECLEMENHKAHLENSCLQKENCDMKEIINIMTKSLKKRQCENDKVQEDYETLKNDLKNLKTQIVGSLRESSSYRATSNTFTCNKNTSGTTRSM